MSSKVAMAGKVILLILFAMLLFALYVALNIFIGVALYDIWGIGGCIGGALALNTLCSGGFFTELNK